MRPQEGSTSGPGHSTLIETVFLIQSMFASICRMAARAPHFRQRKRWIAGSLDRRPRPLAASRPVFLQGCISRSQAHHSRTLQAWFGDLCPRPGWACELVVGGSTVRDGFGHGWPCPYRTHSWPAGRPAWQPVAECNAASTLRGGGIVKATEVGRQGQAEAGTAIIPDRLDLAEGSSNPSLPLRGAPESPTHMTRTSILRSGFSTGGGSECVSLLLKRRGQPTSSVRVGCQSPSPTSLPLTGPPEKWEDWHIFLIAIHHFLSASSVAPLRVQ